jgi:hypothetical protein
VTRPPPDTWQAIDLPDLGVSFRFPRLTPTGQHVVVVDLRIHVQSQGGREVYLEVSRVQGLTAAEAYTQESAFVRDRHGAHVGPLVSATFAGWPAYTFSFRWADTHRVLTYVERGEWLYRVVHDPNSAPDLEILGTIQLQ